MKYSLSLIIAIIVLSSCSEDNKKALNHEETINVSKEDSEMQKAIEKSRNTFSEFLTALYSKDSTINDFAIKVPFKAGETMEHIWLNNIQVENDKIYGIVNNEPEYTREVAFGDTVEINAKTISDWNYIKGNKLYGGYSIKLLRNRMTPEERAEFDQSTGLIIE